MWRRTLLLPSLLAVLALACGGPWGTPRGAAERFWEAMEAGDFEAARQASTAADPRRLEGFAQSLGPREEGAAISFGEALKNAETAIVPTFLPAGEDRSEVVFNTHLTRLDGEWRVDVSLTERELRQASLAASIRDAQDALGEAGRIVGEAIEEGAREASRAMREALEGLKSADPHGRHEL